MVRTNRIRTYRKPLREAYELTEAGLPKNAYISIDEVHLYREMDSYEEGEVEGGSAHKFYNYDNLDCVGDSFYSLEGLVMALSEELNLNVSYDMNDWELSDTNAGISIETDLMVNEDWEEPSDTEWKQFKLGRINLYNVWVLVYVSVHMSLSKKDTLDILETAMKH